MQCYHCGLEVQTEVKGKIKDKEESFCCYGCLGVAQMIAENNLESFYQNKTDNINLKFDNEYPLEYYDHPSFSEEFVENNKLVLVSPTIHCAACAFLIEKTLEKLPEVAQVRVNLTNARIHITLSAKGKISNIFKTLANIGYAAQTLTADSAEAALNQQNQLMLRRIGFAFFTMMNMLWISVALYTGADEGPYHNYFLVLSFILATPTLFYSGSAFFKSSYYALKNLSLNMDVPIVIGALSTYIYSTAVFFGLADGHIYFDTVVNFIFVILIGRYFEASSKKQVLIDTNSIMSLETKVATILRDGKEILTPLKAIQIGDIAIIKSGEKIPLDGIILSGNLSVDESLISGESLPVDKIQNDSVYGGTLNVNGSAKVQISKNYQDSSFNKIKNLIDEAGLNKAKISCLIDSIIPYFVATTIIVAIISFIYNFSFGFDFALMAAVSVLIITCPCAFGIAVPITYAVANTILFKNKVVINNSDILEGLDKVKTVVFDKTGTLTTAQFKIRELKTTIDETKFKQILRSLAINSEHPLSKSIAKNLTINTLEVVDFKNYAGFGISGVIDGEIYFLGSLDFVKQHTTGGDFIFNSANSVVYLANKTKILGAVDLIDEIAKDADKLISYLQGIGKKVVILSGDNLSSVAFVADKLKIDKYYHSQTPESKLEFIKNNQDVLMIGDGINDGPALKAANFSIAISGLDVIAGGADSIVMRGNLKSIITLLKIVQISRRIIKQNIIFALNYNLVFVPLAFLGQINPILAAIVMPISSLIVIFNALRIKLKFKK
jgi:Cu2+-exporting ATPase